MPKPRPASADPRLREFTAAWEELDAEPNPDLWTEGVTRMVDNLPAMALRSALDYVRTRADSKLAQILTVRLLRRWTGLEPRAAANWAASLSSESESMRADAVAAVANVWAEQGIVDALTWARALAAGEARQRGLLAVAFEASRGEPVKALELALELPQSERREELVRHAANQLAATDPDLAAWWAGQLDPGPLRERTLANVAALWADTDPVSAATLALQLPAGRAQDDAVVSIVQRWAQQAPEDAAAWALKFPAGLMRDTSLESVMKLWADRDLDAAGRWLNTLPAGSNRDVAVAAYVTRIDASYPQLAWQWIETIGDETLKARQRESLATR